MKFKKADNSINDLNVIKSVAQNMRDKIIIKGSFFIKVGTFP